MKLLCWNINSLSPTVRNAVLKHGSWAGFFQEHAVDILCLQESKLIDEKLTKELCCVEGFQSFWACSRERKGYSGVVTYASEAWAPLSCRADCLGSGDDDIDREGRVVITDHGAFVLLNVYVPNAGDRPARARLPFKLRFLRALQRTCEELAAQGRELLIVGDFNVPAEARDVHPTLIPPDGFDALYSPEERAALHALTARFTDVWRHLHPEEAATYTVWNEKTSARAFNQGLRIDYVLASPGLLARVEACEVLSAERLPAKWSDHAGLLLQLRGQAPPPAHPPCPEWLRLHRRFVDTSQRSILGMFARKQLSKGADGAAAAAPPGSEAGEAKRRRTGGDGAGGAAPLPPASPAGADGHLGAAAAAEQEQQQQQQQQQQPSRPPQKQQDRTAKAVPGQRTIGSFFAAGGGGGR